MLSPSSSVFRNGAESCVDSERSTGIHECQGKYLCGSEPYMEERRCGRTGHGYACLSARCSHPLAEEIRNQVVVKRGPLVYCLESMDIANGEKIDNILIPADIKLTPKKTTIEGSSIVALEGKARLASSESWEGVLYRPVVQAEKTVDIRLIPYYAWGNRGKGEMTVWMPLAR